MPNILMNPYMIQAAGAMQQMPTGYEAYQRQFGALGQQFGLAQRRGAMQARGLGLPPHLQFAAMQGMYPQLYGQYAGALGQAGAQAGQMDIQRAATMGQFGIGAARVGLEQQRLELMREEMERRHRPNFWNILGTLGTLGMGIAGLAMPPVGAAGAAMGMGAGLGQAAMGGWQQGGRIAAGGGRQMYPWEMPWG